MYALQNEMGETLENALKCIMLADRYVTIEEFASMRGTDVEKAFEILKNLQGKGYVKGHRPHTSYETLEAALSDRPLYRISIEGINYLELKAHWWVMFRVSSIYIPIAVSFVTSLIVWLARWWLCLRQ